MADICTCCGKKIPFLEVDYDYIEIDKVEYRLCGKCRSKINAYNNGNIPVEEVITDATDEKVADYIQNIKSEEDIELEKQEKERIETYIASLEGTEYKVAYLSAIKNKDCEFISKSLGISEGRVKNILTNIKKHCKN